MDEARRALEVTRRMHALATTPEGALLTRVELERLAEQEVATDDGPASDEQRRPIDRA